MGNRRAAQYVGIQGMNKDLSISKFNNQFIFDGINIRLDSVDGDNTLMSITNEKGNKKAEGLNIEGVCIGYCIIDKYLVLFTTIGNTDRIYRIDSLDKPEVLLFTGFLNFSKENLIEALGVKESNSIVKVYWTDGINQPRFINVTKGDNTNNNPNIYNF